jgi:DNA-binding MarR family transcriptional regulator
MWRAINRLMVNLPRILDTDLTRHTSLTLNEYAALMSLSEAPACELRMADLARAVALSPSRVTRLVEDLRGRGLVTKRRSSEDGRGNITRLTPAGFDQLQAAYPVHLASARHRVVSHVSPDHVTIVGQALARIAASLES